MLSSSQIIPLSLVTLSFIELQSLESRYANLNSFSSVNTFAEWQLLQTSIELVFQ